MNLADIVQIDHASLSKAIISEFCKAHDEELSNTGTKFFFYASRSSFF